MWCELVKRELYINNGLIFKEKVDIGEDLAINIQLYSYAEKIVHTPFPFYHYRRTNLNSYCNVRGIKSINSEIQVAKIITLFLNEKYGEKAFKDEIIYRQFVSKMALWTDRSCRDYRRWLTVFPETNQRIWKYKKLSWKTRLECWLAIHGFPGLADGFIQFLHFQRKLRDHFL